MAFTLNRTRGALLWCWKFFFVVFFSKKNLGRDAVILSGLILLLISFWSFQNWTEKNKKQLATVEKAKEEELVLGENSTREESIDPVVVESESVAETIAKIDTKNWTPYQNTWYGFELSYPNNWNGPTIRRAPSGVLWESQIQFRLKETTDDNPFVGFDVVIYPVSKVKELKNTEEFPALKNEEIIAEQPECATLEQHLLETGDYPAEEIYVPIGDECFSATMFFTNTRDQYIYNIAPRLKEGMGLAGDVTEELRNYLPEFFASVSKFNLIQIVRPKPAPLKPKSTTSSAPIPVSYKLEGGRMVCDKKNDKPGKSKTNKKRHLDMECCLDPDEYPNPHCYYPPEKYGKYL